MVSEICVFIQTDRRIDRQIDRQIDGQTVDGQTGMDIPTQRLMLTQQTHSLWRLQRRILPVEHFFG